MKLIEILDEVYNCCSLLSADIGAASDPLVTVYREDVDGSLWCSHPDRLRTRSQ